MRQIQDQFTGCAGVTIFWQAWLPEGAPKAVVVVAHGFGEHSGRYQNLVDALVPSGYAMYAPDHRGHGRSGGHRALIDKHTYLLDDLDRIFTRAATDCPGVPVFLLGHSMGGNIALASALAHQERLTGLILSGPAVTTHGIPKALQMVARKLGKVAPKVGTQKLSSSGVSSDPAVVAAYDTDPLVFHGKMPAGTAAAIIETSLAFPARLPSLRIPLLVVHGSADQLVSVESGKTAHQLAGSADKTLKIYDGFAHEVFNEPKRAEVLADVVHWLDAHVATDGLSGVKSCWS
jgi:alpha-beta hydrolase superfamily lysophospholipase